MILITFIESFNHLRHDPTACPDCSLEEKYKRWESRMRKKYLGSKTAKVLESGDEYAPEVARVGAKLVPASAAVESGKILFTGKDLKGTHQIGLWNRIVKPTLDIVTLPIGVGGSAWRWATNVYSGLSTYDGVSTEIGDGYDQ